MHAPRTVSSIPVPALAILLALSLVAACTGAGPGSTTAASAGAPSPSASAPGSPGASAAAGEPCPTAPAPSPADPPGWPTPGSTTGASVFPYIVSSEQICGRNRFLFSFLDASSNPVAAPDRTATVAFFELGRDPVRPVSTATGTFLWAIEGARGLYVTSVDFPEAGEWGAEFTTSRAGGAPEKIRLRFEVKPRGAPVPVGAAAPSVRTPVAADVGGDLAKISSDKSPDPAFYSLSVDRALATHTPFVIVFATPAFCTSGQCGPTLDVLKGIAKERPGFAFINVEPYQLAFTNGRLQPVLDANGQLQTVPATDAYGLLSEPWIFVVGRDGRVGASFEAIVSPAELTAAIDAAT